MADKKMKKAAFGSLQPDPDIFDWNDLPPLEDFEKASSQEKQEFIQERKSVSYWADAWRRLRHNKVAMVAAVVLVIIMLFAFVGPMLVPYGYAQQIRGAENLHPWHTSLADQLRIEEVVAQRTVDLPSEDEFIDQYVAEQMALAEQEQGRKLNRKEEALIKAHGQ